jgi:tetratricopeptide (TPR) repeat protein
VKGLLFFFLVFLSISACSQNQSVADSTMILVDQTPTIGQKIKILNDASTHLKDTDSKKSFSYATQAYQLAVESSDTHGKIYALLNLGRYYTRLGRHEVAMENYLKALDLCEQIKDEALTSKTYNIIGNGYYFKNDIPLALRYYKKALGVNPKSLSEESTADLQNNIALVYIDQDKLDSAKIYLTNAIEKYQALHLSKKLANALLNWGEIKEKEHDYEEALLFFEKALNLNKALGIKFQEGYSLNKMCGSLIQLNRFKEAELYGKQALTIALEENFQPLLISTYENLYMLSKATKDFNIAIYYHEELLSVKEELFNADQQKQMEELRTKYESEQKEKENQELTKEAALVAKQLLFARLLLALSVVFTLVVSALAYIYYKALVENKKAKADLIKLNDQIQLQKEELSVQANNLILANNEITHINNNLEKLVEEKTSRILQQGDRLERYAFQNSHDVRGPLARILGLVRLLNMKGLKPEEVPFIIGEIENATNQLDLVIRKINSSLEGT